MNAHYLLLHARFTSVISCIKADSKGDSEIKTRVAAPESTPALRNGRGGGGEGPLDNYCSLGAGVLLSMSNSDGIS